MLLSARGAGSSVKCMAVEQAIPVEMSKLATLRHRLHQIPELATKSTRRPKSSARN